MTAEESKMSAMHDALVDALAEDLENEEKRSPALYNVARQMLRDNGITCDGPCSPRMNKLMDNMPDLGELEQ